MADQKNSQDNRDKAPRELDERQLDQASGGARSTSSDPEEGGEVTRTIRGGY
jgi:hypothetical protein